MREKSSVAVQTKNLPLKASIENKNPLKCIIIYKISNSLLNLVVTVGAKPRNKGMKLKPLYRQKFGTQSLCPISTKTKLKNDLKTIYKKGEAKNPNVFENKFFKKQLQA